MRTCLSVLVLFATWTVARHLPGQEVAGGPGDQGGQLQQSAVFTAGEDAYHTYRIPSLLVTPAGTAIALAEGRRGGTSDTGNIDLVMKRSTDGGKTWSKQSVVWDEGPNTCGNPCPAFDHSTGTIWLLMTHNLGKDNEAAISAGKSKGTRTVWITHSKDEGQTWAAPRDITSDVKDPAWGWYATGPGIGIQITRGTHRGRLVIPCDQKNTGRFSHVIYSDDHGKTWKQGGKTVDGCNECQVVELADGRLMLNIRNADKTKQHRQVSLSEDGGLTWSEPYRDEALIEPVCQASILRYRWPTDTVSGEILFSNPASTRRERMMVRMSTDEGKTWPHARVLWEGPSAYSCLGRLADGTILCLHEAGEKSPYQKILLSRFSAEWVKESEPR
ncbi:MAG: sialidase family protein [Pirellulales bacterium]